MNIFRSPVDRELRTRSWNRACAVTAVAVLAASAAAVAPAAAQASPMIGPPVVPEHLYWPNSYGQINQARVDGSHLTVIAAGQLGSAGIAVDFQHAYWSTHSGSGLSSGNPHAILTGIDESAGLAVLVPVSRR